MPRVARIDLEDCCYHVMARGIERRLIFLDDQDRQDFIHRLRKLILPAETSLYAWALMPNHFHLFLQRRKVTLARIMSRLMTGYAVTFNSRHHRTGHLFANRYKAILCQKEPYFQELIRYVHLNPLRAGLVRNLAELEHYPWTGYSILMGHQEATFEAVQEVLENFGSNVGGARENLKSFMAEGLGQEWQPDQRVVDQEKIHGLGPILGSKEFAINLFEKTSGKKNSAQDIPQLRFTDIADAVAREYGFQRPLLHSASRERRVSKARALVCYLSREYGGTPSAELKKTFGLSGGAISQLYLKGKEMYHEVETILGKLNN